MQWQKRPVVRSLVILAVLVGLYAAAGFAIAPRYLRSTLIGQIDRQLGVSPSVGEVRVNPFLFQVEVRDFALPDPAGARILGFQRLFIDFELSSIWHRAYVFRDIEINGPYAHPVVSPAGSLNLLALKPRVPAPAAPVKSGPEPALPPIEVGLFRVTDGDLTYQDSSRATPFSARIEPIHFELRDFATGEEGGRFTFSGSSALGERLEWRGHIVLQPLASEGEFTLSHLQARTVWTYLKDQLGFVVSSGSIDVSGHYDFALREAPQLRAALATLSLSNLGLRPDAGSADWITVPLLRISGTELDLQRRQVTIDGIALTGPRVSLWNGPDGRLNLQQLAATRTPAPARSGRVPPTPAASGAASDAAPAAAAPWQLSLKQLKLSDATIAAEDRSARPYAALTLAPLNLTVTGASLDLGKPVELTFDTGLNGSGHLGLSGTVTPAPRAADLKIDAAALTLKSLQPYLARTTSVTLLDGTLSAALQVRLRPGRAARPALRVTGSLGVDHLHTVDNALRKELVSWERLGISGIRYQHHPDRLELASVTVIKPYARVIIAPDCSLNVAEALRAPGAAPEAGCAGPRAEVAQAVAGKPAAVNPAAVNPATVNAAAVNAASAQPAPAAAGMPIAIAQVTIHSGQAQFADLSITPNFATGIVALEGTVAGLSSNPQSRAHIDLKGQVDQYSPVAIFGDANVLSNRRYLDLNMSFRNMELTTFNPYSGKFAGYNITKGKLTTELQYRIDGRKLDARHHISIDQLEFGDRTASKDAVSLPIKLAVALLKDRNGLIDLDIPVTGSLDDPHFRLGPIIWKVLVNLLVKIVASPFALLGNLFGGGPDLQFVDFSPGSASLNPAGQQRITAVAKALAERPQLKIELPIAVAAAADRPALVEKAFDDELLAEAQRHAAKGAAVTTPDALTVPARVSLETALYRRELGQAPQFPKAPPPAPGAPAPGAPAPDADAVKRDYLEKALHEHIVIGDEALKALAQARAQTLQQALLAGGQIDPTRVFLVVSDKVAVKDSAVRLELTLQ